MYLERVFTSKNTRFLEKVSMLTSATDFQVVQQSRSFGGYITSLVIEIFRSACDGKIKADFYETTEEWYAQGDPDEVDHEERNFVFSSPRVQRMIFHLCTLPITSTRVDNVAARNLYT